MVPHDLESGLKKNRTCDLLRKGWVFVDRHILVNTNVNGGPCLLESDAGWSDRAKLINAPTAITTAPLNARRPVLIRASIACIAFVQKCE